MGRSRNDSNRRIVRWNTYNTNRNPYRVKGYKNTIGRQVQEGRERMTERILLAIVLIYIAIQTGINIWAIKRIKDLKGELDDNRRTHNGNNTN